MEHEKQDSMTLQMMAEFLERRRIKKEIQRIESENAARRGVTACGPGALAGFLEEKDAEENLVFSGENAEEKRKFLCDLCVLAEKRGIPVVLLHGEDRLLEEKLKELFSDTAAYQIVNSGHPFYDPVYGLSDAEIENLLFVCAGRDNPLSAAAGPYLRGICTLLHGLGVTSITTEMLWTCPHEQLYEKTDRALKRGKLTDRKASQIQAWLMQGQSERNGVERFFRELYLSGRTILYQRQPGYRPLNIKKAIREKRIFSLSASFWTNQRIQDVIFYELENEIRKGHRFLLILDEVPIKFSEKLQRFIQGSGESYAVAVASADLYAASGEKETFEMLTGKAKKCFVMRHGAGKSGEMWAETFGRYEKQEITVNRGQHRSFRNGYRMGTNQGYSVSWKNEYIIRPEEVQYMDRHKAYVLDKEKGQIWQLSVL